MENNYIVIYPQLLINFNILPCDVYLKLEKNQKILKIANKNDSLSQDFNYSFAEKNHPLLIQKEDLMLFFDNSIHRMNLEVLQISPPDKNEVLSFFYQYEEMMTIAFDHKISINAKNSLKNLFYDFFVKKEIINSPLYNYLCFSQIIKNKAFLRMILTLYMAKQISFLKPNSYVNINTVSFFCDISLVENNDIKNHHFNSAQIVSKDKKIFNEDVYLGILHHHEYIDGTGLLKLEARRIHDYGNLIRSAEDFIDSNFKIDLYSIDLFHKYSKNNIIALRKIMAG